MSSFLFKPRLRRPSFLSSVAVNTVRVLAIVALMGILACVGVVLGIARAYVDTAPTLDLTLIDDQAQTSFLYDADRNLITDYKGTENRVMVSISQVPEALQHAFVAVEDARFYTHNGLDIKRIVGALVNKDYIVMIGSSAGAITALQVDYAMCNGFLNSDILPEDFRLAGVVSYAGAIFSHEGKVQYRNREPAPTMMFHGTMDNLVSYKGISFFNIGFYGTDALVKRFEKYDYPYFARRFEGYGHSVAAGGPLTVDDLVWFCRHYIYGKEKLQVDGTYTNLDPTTMPPYDFYSPKDLYK